MFDGSLLFDSRGGLVVVGSAPPVDLAKGPWPETYTGRDPRSGARADQTRRRGAIVYRLGRAGRANSCKGAPGLVS